MDVYSLSGPGDCAVPAADAVCNLPQLAPGDTAAVVIALDLPAAPGLITAEASVVAAEPADAWVSV